MGFVPISMDDYVRGYLKSNPGADPNDLRRRLQDAIDAHRRGGRCACGNPIWVIGSAEAGVACFTCITGDAFPQSDYELASACMAK